MTNTSDKIRGKRGNITYFIRKKEEKDINRGEGMINGRMNRLDTI